MSTEKKKTIVQAITEVLKAAKHPMTAAEIYEDIVKGDLYKFNAKTPVQIVRAQIRRHCEGIDLPNISREKFFKRLDNKKFDLI